MGHAQSHQPSRGGLRTTNEAIQPDGYFCSDGELGACVTSGPSCVRCICLHAPHQAAAEPPGRHLLHRLCQPPSLR